MSACQVYDVELYYPACRLGIQEDVFGVVGGYVSLDYFGFICGFRELDAEISGIIQPERHMAVCVRDV